MQILQKKPFNCPITKLTTNSLGKQLILEFIVNALLTSITTLSIYFYYFLRFLQYTLYTTKSINPKVLSVFI